MTDPKVREAGSWIFSLIGRVLLFSIKATFVLIVGFVVWWFYLSWDVDRWDAKIDALCAANGGRDVAIRVYETVAAPLTKEYFAELDPPRSLFVAERSEGQDLGPKYPYVQETRVVQVLRDKNPSVVKYTERIVRVSDNKILAEQFGYQRAGGGLPMFDPGEIRNCPDGRLHGRLDVQVFVNHPQHAQKERK